MSIYIQGAKEVNSIFASVPMKGFSIYGNSVQDGAPTPDTPIEIESVEVSEIKSVGKNLQYNSATYDGWLKYNNGGTVTTETYNGGKVVKYTSAWNYLYPPNRLFKAGTYTISFDAKSKAVGSAYISGLGVGKQLTVNTNYTRYSHTFTLAEDKNGYIAPLIPSNSTVGELYIANIQVEEGNATSYEPYKESKVTLSTPITLRGIGDVKDVLCKQNGAYGVLRKFSVKTVSSVDNVQTIDGNNVQCNNSSIFTDRKVSVNYVSNRFKRLSTQSLGKTDEGIIFNSSETNKRYLYIFIDKSRLSASAETTSAYKTAVNTWLTSNSLEVMYELATPTFEPLPEADQNALKKLETFSGEMNVFTDSDIEPTVEIELVNHYEKKEIVSVWANKGGVPTIVFSGNKVVYTSTPTYSYNLVYPHDVVCKEDYITPKEISPAFTTNTEAIVAELTDIALSRYKYVELEYSKALFGIWTGRFSKRSTSEVVEMNYVPVITYDKDVSDGKIKMYAKPQINGYSYLGAASTPQYGTLKVAFSKITLYN